MLATYLSASSSLLPVQVSAIPLNFLLLSILGLFNGGKIGLSRYLFSCFAFFDEDTLSNLLVSGSLQAGL